MASRTLPEERLHPFLRRKRKGTGVITPPPLGQFLAETLELASRLIPAEAGSLLLDHPGHARRKTSPLTFVATFGPASDRVIGMKIPAGQGIVGHVYRSGQTYCTSSVSKDPHFFPVIDDQASFRTRSVLAAPVRLENSVCGVLELINRRSRSTFTTRDVELAELLSQYISRAILNAVDVLKQNELALYDELTGLRNVRGLDAYLESSLKAAEAADTDLAVIFIDVDHLKAVNDRLGHRAGSDAIRRIGLHIRKNFESYGVPFRFGGDEFVVVCPGLSLAEAVQLSEQLRFRIRSRRRLPEREKSRASSLAVSIGIATLRTSITRGRTGSARARSARLLIAADRALYRAKREGRDRIVQATRLDQTQSTVTRK